MSWFRTIIFLGFAFTISSEPNHHKSSAVIVGTVYCDTCFQQNFHKNSHFISGASVAVECKDSSSRGEFRQVVQTDGRGEFKVHLPFPISKHVNKIRGCSVRLINSNKPYCSIAATASSSNLNLKSRKQGTHVFSAGFFTFRPFQQPEVCDQKPGIKNHNMLKDSMYEKSSPISNPNDPTFLPPIQDPPSEPPALGGYLPPLPRLPSLPPLPRLPPLPGLPFLPPVPKKEAADKTPKLANSAISLPNTIPFPTNPLNPPGIFPTNPFLPPALGIFPTPPLFNLPPVPGFSASVPPTFPIPRFPFQPTPGAPPAEVSSPRKQNSP